MRVQHKAVNAARPGSIVAIESVQQIEHGIALCFVIVCGQGHGGVAHRARNGGGVGYALRRAVRTAHLRIIEDITVGVRGLFGRRLRLLRRLFGRLLGRFVRLARGKAEYDYDKRRRG